MASPRIESSEINALKTELSQLASIRSKMADMPKYAGMFQAAGQVSALVKSESCVKISQLGMAATQLHAAGLQFSEIATVKNIKAMSTVTSAATQAGSSKLSELGTTLAQFSPVISNVVNAATLIYRTFKKRKKRNDPHLEALAQCTNAILSHITNVANSLHQSMSAYFEASFENDRLLLNEIRDGFAQLCQVDAERGFRAEFIANHIEERFNRLEAITHFGFKYVSLKQQYFPLLEKVNGYLNGDIPQVDSYHLQEAALQLAGWIKAGGQASDLMYTGGKWALDIHSNHQLADVVNRLCEAGHLADLSSMNGFLAYYAKAVIGIDIPKSVYTSIFNEKIWLEAAEQYLALLEDYQAEIPDRDNELLKSVIASVDQHRQFKVILRSSPTVVEHFLDQCKERLNEIGNLMTQAIDKYSLKIKNQVDDVRGNNTDILVDVTNYHQTLESFAKITPSNLTAKGGTPYTDYPDIIENGIFCYVLGSGATRYTEDSPYSLLLDTLQLSSAQSYPFEFAVLESFKLGNFIHDYKPDMAHRMYPNDPKWMRHRQINSSFSYNGSKPFNVMTINQHWSHAGSAMQQQVSYPNNIDMLRKEAREKIAEFIHNQYKSALSEFSQHEPSKSQLESSMKELNAQFNILMVYLTYLGYPSGITQTLKAIIDDSAKVLAMLADPSITMKDKKANMAQCVHDIEQFKNEIVNDLASQKMHFTDTDTDASLRQLRASFALLLKDRPKEGIVVKKSDVMSDLKSIIQTQHAIIKEQREYLDDALSQLKESRSALAALKSEISLTKKIDKLSQTQVQHFNPLKRSSL